MHKNSPKLKSKIRIIHIFAPQIIKTDAANFRELVQRLTGKPSDDDVDQKSTKRSRPVDQPIIENNNNNNNYCHEPNKKRCDDDDDEGFREKIKGEEEIWRDANTGGGFLEFDEHDDDDHGGFLQVTNNIINNDQYFPFVEGTTTTAAQDYHGCF